MRWGADGTTVSPYPCSIVTGPDVGAVESGASEEGDGGGVDAVVTSEGGRRRGVRRCRRLVVAAARGDAEREQGDEGEDEGGRAA